MAHFRGVVHGARGPASRLGTSKSGLCIEAQSYQGKVVVDLYVNKDGVDCAHVLLAPHMNSGDGSTRTLYDGPVDAVTSYTLTPTSAQELRP